MWELLYTHSPVMWLTVCNPSKMRWGPMCFCKPGKLQSSTALLSFWKFQTHPHFLYPAHRNHSSAMSKSELQAYGLCYDQQQYSNSHKYGASWKLSCRNSIYIQAPVKLCQATLRQDRMMRIEYASAHFTLMVFLYPTMVVVCFCACVACQIVLFLKPFVL